MHNTPLQGTEQCSPVSVGSLETAWAALVAVLTTFSLVAVGLAQLGIFGAWAVAAAVLVACVAGWGAWRFLRSLNGPTPRCELTFLAILVVSGGLLYSWPAEEFPQNGDASIYPNTATMLLRAGGLTYHYAALDGLTAEQKEMFYVPADRQLSNLEIQSYEGLLYGAYYVLDPEQNSIVSSRPPLTIAWMGLFGMLGGERAVLYVTPIFGTLSLVAVYFLGKRLFGTGAGALAALWLLVSFPQLYFSRTSYAEVVGQFFVLSFLYALTSYWQTRRAVYVSVGLAALAAAFAARIDVILALPTLLLFFFLLALRREWKATCLGLLDAAVALTFTLWTVNRPYVGATAELLLRGQLRLLGELPVSAWLGLGALGLGCAALLAWLVSRIAPARRIAILRWGLAILVIAGVAYALWLRPLLPEYAQRADGGLYPTHNEEILSITAKYVSPLFVWLAAAGATLLPWRKRFRVEQLLLLAFVASFAGAFFWKYTTARVYPVALRRLLPEVLPVLSLFGASAVAWLARHPRLRWLALGAAGVTAALLLSVSGPYWFHQGSRGAMDLLNTLAERIPDESMVLFEPQQEGSIANWFASPLWSSEGTNTLQLNDAELDAKILDQLLCAWHRDGTAVYLVAQKDPDTWWPGGFSGHAESTVNWKSSIIGQSLLCPPFIWRFDFQLQILQFDGSACPAG